MASAVQKVACALLATTVAVLVVVVVRTVTVSVREDDLAKCRPSDSDFITADSRVVERFSKALQIQTVTWDAGNCSTDELTEFREFVQKGYSLLYTIKGSDNALRPYILTSHFDVVPVDPSKWEEPPFSGKLTNGYIYGRGAIDDKHGVMGIYEALEYLLSAGFKPRRSLFIAFGHDEEGQGNMGAKKMGELLSWRGVRDVEFLLDEGLTVLDGVLPGVDVPLGIIGSSEKGQVVLELSAESAAGHSSMPPHESCVGILARAVARLEENPHPSMFGRGPEKGTFELIAHKMSLPLRVVMSNLWLFSPAVSWLLSQKPHTNAVARTVTSVTLFNAGVKNNVLPTKATAVVNHRIHPAQTVQEVIDFDRRVIADDRVKIRVIHSMEPLPMSPYGSEDFGYQTIKNSIAQVFPVAAVAPSVMIGNTDTRHYTHLTNNIYRFSPTYNYPEDLPRFHGNNERISVKNYEQAINFFYHLMKNADEPGLKPLHKHTEEF